MSGGIPMCVPSRQVITVWFKSISTFICPQIIFRKQLLNIKVSKTENVKF
jgi:hypothetical protein